MSAMKEVFGYRRPVHRRNFVKENVRFMKEMQNLLRSREVDILPTEPSKQKIRNKSAKIVNQSFQAADKNTIAKHSHLKPGGRTVTFSHSAHGNQTRTVSQKQNVRSSRKARNVGKIHKDVTADNVTKLDVAEYVQKQSGMRDSNSSTTEITADSLSSFESAENIKQETQLYVLKHTGCQTLEPAEIAELYEQGVIRYPSSTVEAVTKHAKSGSDTPIHVQKENKYVSPRAKVKSTELVDMKGAYGDVIATDNINVHLKNLSIYKGNENNFNAGDSKIDKDGIKMTAKTMAARRKVLAPSSPDPLKAPPNYQKGVVPRYLRTRQEVRQREKEQSDFADPDCPPGHVALPDLERKETLRMLRKNYADLINELNMLPVRTDTLKMRQRKMDIEKQLTKLEEGIKVFSKPKVFVKIGV